MKILIAGASKGLGKAFVEGLPDEDDTVIGISRSKPNDLHLNSNVVVDWIEVDMADPIRAADIVEKQIPAELDVVIYNLGIWEKLAFTGDYQFLQSSDDEIVRLVQVNITSAMILLKRVIPTLLDSARPQIVLTGSTSGLTQSGQPEVAFGASKFALRGIADALREGFRRNKLAVTCLQLGDLNTDDGISEPLDEACRKGAGRFIPVHDVVSITKSLLNLSSCSFVKEIVLPAIYDERF
ncbi:MAG: SDR family NAD(P)-dependent oxidoreductase [Proteobacteria bacterium]|nr:MAG: SDR family NAD(P)-dependent oxidoreductase [Pseudomonadota bacterium]